MLQMSRAVVTHRRLLLFKWLMVFLPSATVAVGHSLIAHTGAETHGLPTITATLPVTFFGLVLTYIFVETLFRVLRRLQVEALARLLGTRWGLFQHYWVLISFLLTVIATAVLLLETRTISYLAGIAADPATSGDDLRALGNTLLHSVGGTVVLLVIMWLNVYTPQGLNPYGWRKQQEERKQRTVSRS